MNFFIATDITLLCLVLWIWISLSKRVNDLRLSFIAHGENNYRQHCDIVDEMNRLTTVKVVEKTKPKSRPQTSSQTKKIVPLRRSKKPV